MATGLFEVEVNNHRVVKESFNTRRIKGAQEGDQEQLYFLTEPKEEEDWTMKALKSRIILGMTRGRKKKSKRE